jgi:glycerol-3-phosphate acyltransferase PlsY
MGDVHSALIALALGYLLGAIPFGLFFAWISGAGDVRKIGSGNIGATNVLRTGKKWAAAATLLCDGAKGAAAVLIARQLLPPGAETVAAAGAVLGHIFPVWLRFKGGKGVATFLGISLALYWLAGLAVAATWLLMALGLRISSLSALIAVALAPFFFWLTGHGAYAPVLALLALLIVIMHHANIRRLLNGTEPRIGSKGRTAANSEAIGHKKRGG